MEQVDERVQVRGHLGRFRRPAGAQFERDRGLGADKVTEAGGRGLGDGAACGTIGGTPLVQRIDQPAPADGGQHLVGAHLRVELGRGERDQAQYPVPRLDAVGVVQQHQPTGCEIVAVGGSDIGRDGVAPRCEPLGRAQRLDTDLGAYGGAGQARDGRAEDLGACLIARGTLDPRGATLTGANRPTSHDVTTH
jgi:hypothetical protein